MKKKLTGVNAALRLSMKCYMMCSRKSCHGGRLKKTVTASMGMLALATLLGGCAHVSQKEVPDNDHGSIVTDAQVVETQVKTDIPAGIAPQDTTVFIDEKLDENLFIGAELKMPEKNLYEYVTQLKSFDYDKVQEAIGQNEEGILAVDDGNDGFTGGSLTYQRNDMASHLETYCSYAEEMGLADGRDLCFMSKEDAARRIQSLVEMLGVGGELETLNVVAMDHVDFENVKKAIMEDDGYRGVLSAKGYESDTFDEGMEVYRIRFRMNVNGIPVYRNEPELRGTSERFMAYPVSITALLSNNGIEMITMMGMFEHYEGQQKEAVIIGEDDIKEASLKQISSG